MMITSVQARQALLVVGWLLLAPGSGAAQAERSLSGLIRDSAGLAIPSAEVRSRGVIVARSDDSGRFHVAQMPAGARGVFVRRLGFAPLRVLIPMSASGAADSVVVTLAALATTLPSVAALARHDSISHKLLADFWERRARGFGRFITRDEIEARGAIDFADLFRSVASMSVQNFGGRGDIRFSRGSAPDCAPQYWVDGIPIVRGSADGFTSNDVEAVELYAGPATTPPRFTMRGPSCGTIVIWTRLPG